MATIYAAVSAGDGGSPEIFTVTNVIKADDADIPTGFVVCPQGTAIGDTHDVSAGTFTPPVPAVYTPVTDDYIRIVQNHLDEQAQALNYDGILSAVTYADEPADTTFQNEGIALRSWRSLVWAACYVILADVAAATRTAPTLDEIITELDASTPYVPPA